MYLRDSQTVFTAFTGMSASAVATLRRKRRQSHIINPKKMFEEVRALLSSLVHASPYFNALSVFLER